MQAISNKTIVEVIKPFPAVHSSLLHSIFLTCRCMKAATKLRPVEPMDMARGCWVMLQDIMDDILFRLLVLLHALYPCISGIKMEQGAMQEYIE